MLSSDPNTIFCKMTNLIWAIAFFTVRVSKSIPNKQKDHKNMYEHLSSAIVNFGRYACWRLSQGNPPSPIVKDCERLCSAGRLGQSLVLCSTMCVLQCLFYNVMCVLQCVQHLQYIHCIQCRGGRLGVRQLSVSQTVLLEPCLSHVSRWHICMKHVRTKFYL